MLHILRKLRSDECVTGETDDLLLFVLFHTTISSEIMTFVFRPEALTCSTDKMNKEVKISYNDRNVLYLVAGFVLFNKKNVFQ